MARGLDAPRLLRQWATIDQLNANLGREFRVLKGIEVDILEKGGLDLPDDVLAQADWVVASVHYGQKQPREQITSRIVDALANPCVHAIAHPTGRLINRRDPYDVDLEAVLKAAQTYRKCLELNAHPSRLDLDDVHCAAAKELGIPLVICTDCAQRRGAVGDALRRPAGARAGLTKADVANTRTWSQLRDARSSRLTIARASHRLGRPEQRGARPRLGPSRPIGRTIAAPARGRQMPGWR